MRLFRNLPFVGKALLISAIFLAVVAQLGFIYVRATNLAIHASQRELAGLVHVRALVKVLGGAEELRRLGLQAGAKPDAAVQQQLARVESDLAAAETLDPAGLQLTEAMKFLRDAFTPLKTPAADGEEAFTRADDFMQQVMRTVSAVADSSALSLDPDADSYHLMLASTHDTLDVRRRLGRLRDLGAHALAAGGPLPALHAKLLRGDSYVLYDALEAAFGRYETIVKQNPALADGLAFQEAFKPLNALLRAARKGPLTEPAPAGDAAAYAATGAAALESVAALGQRSLQALDGLIAARIDSLQRQRNLHLALVGVGLLVAGYCFYCFYVATRDGLKAVTLHVEAMAHGDLSTTPEPEGRDEAAELMHSIRDMQSALQQLVGEVRDCADVIVTASTEVSSGAGDLSLRTERSASSLQQTASSMEHIAATVQTTAQRSAESAALGRDNARVAGEGGEVIAQVIATMQSIQASSSRIADITGVIDGIAFQTNILALNAAVEAARAGEQGRGFAVVASEVRALAQRSGAAAREIKALVVASTEQTAEGSRIVGTAGETMNRLMANARTMSELLDAVSAAAGEQTRGVSEVGHAVAELDQDTQRNAALVEETSAAALSMKQRAGELARTAERFVLPANG